MAARLDVTPPQVAVLTPANGSAIQYEDSRHLVTVTGVVTGDVQIDKVLVNGELAVTNGSSWTATVRLENGANTLQIVATDKAGNRGLARLHTLIGQPSFGIWLEVNPPSARVGDLISYTAVAIATDLLTGTVTFPFSAEGLRVITRTASSDSLVLRDTLASWSGVVRPASPVTITWSARATKVEARTIYALVQGEQMLSHKSNEIAVDIRPVFVYL